jgi:actin-related protein
MNIIIDIGTKLTKVGYGGESEPRKILPTPMFFNYEQYMEDDTMRQWRYNEPENKIEKLNFEVLVIVNYRTIQDYLALLKTVI